MTKTPWLPKRKKVQGSNTTLAHDEVIRQQALALLPPGIVNSANDCFANSVLQALIGTPLLEDLIMFRVGDNGSGDPTRSPALTNARTVAGSADMEWIDGLKLSDTFLRFMEAAYHARNGPSSRVMNPREIIKTLGSKFDQYLDVRQQDAHEFLRHLLDAMYMDEMDVIKKRQPPPDPKSASSKARERERSRNSTSSRTSKQPRLEPFASAVFGGRLASFLVCNSCKHVSHTYEDFLDLSLPIKAEDAKKKGSFRAFAQKVSASLALQPYSNQPSRPSTPVPTSTSGPKTAPLATLVDPPSPTGEPAVQSDIRRSVSVKLNRSRERFDQIRGATSHSRHTSMGHHEQARPQKRFQMKPTPQETAYLRALLRDEPSQSNPLALLRTGPMTSGTSAPTSSNYMWGRIGSSTTSILDCLRMFTSVEILEGDNSFACHNCWKIANPDAPRKRTRRRQSDSRLHSTSSRSSSSSTSSSSSGASERSDYKDQSKSSRTDDLLRPPSTSRAISEDARLMRHEMEYLILDGRPLSEPIGETALIETLTNTSIESLPDSTHPLFVPAAFNAPSSAHALVIPSISTTRPPSPTNNPASRLQLQNGAVPRFRRFSSFHTEKLLSPNLSRESLASAPAGESARLELQALNSGPEGGSAVISEDEASENEVDVAQSSFKESDDMYSVQERHSASIRQVFAPQPLSVIGLAEGATVTPSASLPPSSTAISTLPLPASSLPSTHIVKRSEQVILRPAFKRYLIDVPPPVLIIHLKRFQQIHRGGNSGGGYARLNMASTFFAGSAKKLEDFVSFPEILDLRPFLAPRKERFGLDERGRTPLGKGDSGKEGRTKHGQRAHVPHRHWGGWVENNLDTEEPPVAYRLYGIVVHIGNMLGGHYIAYIAVSPPASDPAKNDYAEGTPLSTEIAANKTTPSNYSKGSKESVQHHSSQSLPRVTLSSRQWCYVSDTTVRLASVEEVFKSRAYLLFYERMP